MSDSYQQMGLTDSWGSPGQPYLWDPPVWFLDCKEVSASLYHSKLGLFPTWEQKNRDTQTDKGKQIMASLLTVFIASLHIFLLLGFELVQFTFAVTSFCSLG